MMTRIETKPEENKRKERLLELNTEVFDEGTKEKENTFIEVYITNNIFTCMHGINNYCIIL